VTRREFAFMTALIVVGIPAGMAVIWLLDVAAGTSWALPVAAVVLLAVFLVDFGAGKVKAR
jgi:energy-converting hydrogenase Eha subunit C